MEKLFECECPKFYIHTTSLGLNQVGEISVTVTSTLCTVAPQWSMFTPQV